MTPPETLNTERLRLRLPVQGDAPFVCSYACDPKVARYMAWPRHTSIADTRTFLARCTRVWEDASAFPWLLVRTTDGQPLGMVELRIESFRADVGFVVHPDVWGQGYAPEAVAALRDWALAQPDIYRFWAFCDVENHASRRVLEKVGMRHEGILRRWAVLPNISDEPRDCHCYALVQ